MKNLTILFAICFVFEATANSKIFTYDGTQNSVELLLSSQKNHTESRKEERQTICSERQQIGIENKCTDVVKKDPFTGAISITVQCGPTPIYSDVKFPCTKVVDVPYDVKDYDVEAKVTVNVVNLSSEVSQGEEIRVNLKGDVIELQTMKTSKKFFIVNKNQVIKESMNGSVKSINAEYTLELVQAAPVLLALKQSGLKVENSALTLPLGAPGVALNLDIALKVVKKKRVFGSDKTLIDRALNNSEITTTNSGAESAINVDLGKLGVDVSSGTLEITTQISAKLGGTLLNAKNFPAELKASQTISIKN